MDGHFAVAHTASSYTMLINRSGGIGQGEFTCNGCKFEDVLWADECSVQMKSHRRFCYRKIGDAPKPKPRHMYRSYYIKVHCTGPTFVKVRTVCIMQAHNAKTKTKSHPLFNNF